MFSWQRLHRELPLSAEELEDVFDSLDTARTGYLTLEAFSSGFSRFPVVQGLTTVCCLSKLEQITLGYGLFANYREVEHVKSLNH